MNLKAAYCPQRQEHLQAGDAGDGAYTCYFRLANPQGYEIVKGGPPNLAAIRSAPGSHGVPQPVLATADAMAERRDSWAGKKQSGKAYLGSPRLKRSQLQQMAHSARENFGVEVRLLKEGDEMLDKMRAMRMRAAFQASTKTVFLQPQATYYELAHELKHAEQCAQLGAEVYAKQSRLDKEMYVYEQLVKDKHNLTPEELKDATRYVNDLRVTENLSLLTPHA